MNSWFKIVAVGKPERQERKASHYSGEQQHEMRWLIYCLYAPHTHGCISSRTSRL